VVDRWINTKLGSLGAFVARKPITVLLVSLTVSLVLCTGLFRLFDLVEDDAERLWCELIHHSVFTCGWMQPICPALSKGQQRRCLQCSWDSHTKSKRRCITD
jgi:hypothetical protein